MRTHCFHKISFCILLMLVIFFSGLLPEGHAQSGFSALHGNSGGSSYSFGQLFYRQYQSEIAVSEGVEQSYLLCDTVVDTGCEEVPYNNFGIEYGDTLVAGIYKSRKYMHAMRNGYDSLFVHWLTVYPGSETYDTLILAENDLGSHSVGASVDTLHSSHGCDSVVFRMVYAVACPDDYLSTASYGVSEVPLSMVEPVVTPSLDGISIISDRPPLLTVGAPVHVSWLLTTGSDTFRCVQNVLVDYPPCGGGFTAEDGDGNVYETVRIGADCWLKGNIRTTHYAGTGEPVAVAGISRSPYGCDTVANLQDYGRLYSWYSAVGLPEGSNEEPPSNADGQVQGVCPVGWHVPSLAELSALQRYDGADLKATGNLWVGETPTDASHLSIVPAGMYNATLNRYELLKAYAYLWSAERTYPTVASAGCLPYACEDFGILLLDNNNGCSVRCAKD